MDRVTGYDIDGVAAPKAILDDNGCCDCCDDVCSDYMGEYFGQQQCIECPIQQCFTTLANYEDDEENDILVRLPAKINSILYHITDNKVTKFKVLSYTKYATSLMATGRDYATGSIIDIDVNDLYKTRGEASYKLKNMEEAVHDSEGDN